MATRFNDENKPPMANPTYVTWIAVATVAVIIAMYILWALYVAAPTIMR